MAIVRRYIEAFFGHIFYNYKQRGACFFMKRVPFKDPLSSLAIKCPELGETNILKRRHTLFGESELSILTRSSNADTLQRIREFAFIIEDADVPIPSPIVHGLYFSIPLDVRSLSHQDLLAIKNDESTGMKYGLNVRKNLWAVRATIT